MGRERARLEAVVETFRRIDARLNDVAEFLDLARDENDESMIAVIAADLKTVEGEVGELEFRRMFSGEMDANNAFLEIQSGTGGTEAQDWASMLLRMYLRWAERRGFKTELIEQSDGEVAGIKGATIRIEGPYAFGWMRTETGVHRLVRKSPFDSGNRRHTSFASVFVSPEVDEDFDIEINPADSEGRHLPCQRRRRPARQPHRVGNSHHPCAEWHRRCLPERPLAAQEPLHGDENAQGANLRDGDAET